MITKDEAGVARTQTPEDVMRADYEWLHRTAQATMTPWDDLDESVRESFRPRVQNILDATGWPDTLDTLEEAVDWLTAVTEYLEPATPAGESLVSGARAFLAAWRTPETPE